MKDERHLRGEERQREVVGVFGGAEATRCALFALCPRPHLMAQMEGEKPPIFFLLCCSVAEACP